MTQNRFYSSVAFPTFLTSSVGSSGNPQVSSIVGLPTSYPFTMLIDWGLSTQEAISVTSAPTGTGPYTLPCTRGIDGTTAQSHSQNAVIVHGVTAEDYNEPQVHISLATSGTGINVVHGLANGSTVVGTTDTQTLTNKTLTGVTVSGGAAAFTNSDATNPIVTITNTHSTPASAILRIVANAAADASFGIRVSGDTVSRLAVDSNGKHQWGPGGSTAVDTNFYRSGVGTLTTDTVLVVGTSLTSATVAVSSSQAAGALITITNTHSAPSAPNMQQVANAAADTVSGIKVSGDTNFRFTIDSNGKQAWGSGSGSSDANLYRSASGILSTDNTLTATVGLQVGSATTGFGSGTGGILGITNAGTPPTTTISGGSALFSQSGLLKTINANSLVQILTGSTAAAVGGVNVNNTATETVVVTQSIPGNDPVAGAVYTLTAFGVLSTPASAGAIPTVNVRWGGTAGTILAGVTPSAAPTNSLSAVPVWLYAQVVFITTTSAVAFVNLSFQNATSNTGQTTWSGVSSATVTGLTTNSAQSLVLDWKWASAVSGDTANFYIGQFERLS